MFLNQRQVKYSKVFSLSYTKSLLPDCSYVYMRANKINCYEDPALPLVTLTRKVVMRAWPQKDTDFSEGKYTQVIF